MQNRRIWRPGGTVSWAVALACAVAPTDVWARGPATPPRPVDPEVATPHMRAPGGQPADDRRRWDGNWADHASSRRRVALSLTPLFASYRMAFLGRPLRPIRGGGIGTDLDVEIVSPVSLRLSASYTGHRVEDEYDNPDDDAPTLIARRGTLHTLDLGGAVVFAMDIGRARPILEAGLGGTIIRPPRSAMDGQRGGVCLAGGGCDVGLVCATQENMCRQGVVPRVHAGAGIEVRLNDRWGVAAMVRYFALLSAPSVFPVYLQTGIRVSVRF